MSKARSPLVPVSTTIGMISLGCITILGLLPGFRLLSPDRLAALPMAMSTSLCSAFRAIILFSITCCACGEPNSS